MFVLFCRPNSRLGSADIVQGTSNYQDYRDIQPSTNRHVSDSNMSKYSNFYPPPPRGQSSLTDQTFQSNQYSQQPQHSSGIPRGPTPTHDRFTSNTGIQRGPTPTHDRLAQHTGIQRGPTPSYDYNTNIRSVNGNYQMFHRVQTPQTVPAGDRWNYVDSDDLRRGNFNTNRTNLNSNRDHLTRQEVLPPSGGNYSNSSYAYRDPVFTSVAGKRPVKSLTQQPNSAKV